MSQIQPPEDFQTPHSKSPFEKFKHLIQKVVSGFISILKKLLPQLKKSADKTMPLLIKAESQIPAPAKIYYQRFYGRWIVLGLIVFLAFSMTRGCFGGKRSKATLNELVAKESQKEDGPIPVKGFKVGRFNFEDSLNALGTLKGAMEFKLSFEVPGTISSINYREGERYEEGALLVSLKQDDILLRLKRAQAELNKFHAKASIAEEKSKDHEKLFAMGAITKSALESAKLEHESTQYESEAARLEVKAAEAMLEKSNLYAPSAGMIGELNIEEGETVTQNTLLGTHVNVEYVYAEFGVVERDVNKIALGQKARIFVDAFPDKTFEGVIENAEKIITGTSRTATVKVRIENPDLVLLPGMFARIRILLYSKKNTLVVPTDSIQGAQGEQFIYVLNSENDAQAGETAGSASPKEEAKGIATVEKRAITVGYNRPDYSQVDAGISEGEVVAVSGLERLEDGKKVRLLEIQEAEV